MRLRSLSVFLSSLACLMPVIAALPAAIAQEPIRITADLTDAPRKLFHAEMDLPVKPGPVTLVSPEWIPGHHMPSGPAADITGVVFTVDGKTIPWRRDDVDLYEYHVTVPQGASMLHVHLDCIVNRRVSQKMAALEWESVLLYPAHTPVREIPIQPSVKAPDGWGIGTALTPAGAGAYPVPAAGSTTTFAVTNVEQLQDSPIITGQYFHEYALAPTISPKHYLDVAADYPEDAELRPAVLAELANLVREADALYASHHYNEYHFLLTLSDVAGGMGLEHGQSSDNGVGEKGMSSEAQMLPMADLLSHEFTHSWNGKYRRPAGLYQSDFATPMQGAMLWVYEGMTQYLGEVLAARSGLKTPEQFRDTLAMTAAELDTTAGRAWRPTVDTAVAASILRSNSPAWNNWRREQDYYYEGEMLWLDADTLIRQLTGNKKSLDDFQKTFLGKGGNTGPLIAPYTFDEVVADLNQVAPYDWAKFLHERVDQINAHVDAAGIERGGYRLVYKEEPTKSEQTMDQASMHRGSLPDFWYSLGVQLRADGRIADVLWNGPADKARLAPGYKIIAVNGEIFSGEALHKAVRAAKTSTEPIHLIVQADNFVHTADVDYHGGERYPALVRVEGTPAYVDDIARPLTKPEKAPEAKKNGE